MTSTTTEVPHFKFGLEYIRGHFGSNVALATQQATHNLYRQNPEPLIDHLLRSLELSGAERVLDIGCGNGFILRDVVSRLRHGGRAVAIDISPAMLEMAQRNVTVSWVPLDFVEGRAEDLSPYPDGSFDRVMANYIFHYIEDPDVVLAGMKRVLAPDGRAVVTIEARWSMPEMYQMHFAAMEQVGFPADFIRRLPRGRRGRMVLDNSAEFLQRHFDRVEERPYVDALRFDRVEPYMTFYADGHRYCGAKAMGQGVIPDELFACLHDAVEAEVARRIADEGHFELTKHNSVFVCA